MDLLKVRAREIIGCGKIFLTYNPAVTGLGIRASGKWDGVDDSLHIKN
jgi:hypothetical protein